MTTPGLPRAPHVADGPPPRVDQPSAGYRHLWRVTLVRLLLTYLAPLLLLSVVVHLQYRHLAAESTRRHLMSVADNQARTVDLFLRERVVNLVNLVDDPRIGGRPTEATTAELLARLQRDSSTFVDLGFFDAAGTMTSYAGPFPTLLGRDYSGEEWFVRLIAAEDRFVVTDLYLGFRQAPHFTIAVRGANEGGPALVRATVDPERFSRYITGLEESQDVRSVLVNTSGSYQTVDLPAALSALDEPLVPPRDPRLGAGDQDTRIGSIAYAYCWLDLTDWALIVVWTGSDNVTIFGGYNVSLLAASAAVILAVFSTIVIRARRVVHLQKEQDTVRRELSGQLHHAARLASVGELAAGVAHEINNPLAVIAEETGLLQDLMDPELGQGLEESELREHLGAIRDAVFRARDITQKLLSFVRRGEVQLARQDLNELVEEVIGLLEREMTVSNIEVERRLGENLPPVLCDRVQIEQVLINLVTNAVDAMPGGGRLTLATSADGDTVSVAVADTGVGIAPEHMEKIFMPFHTTKEVGRGTGLGLSVSYGIVRGYGGRIVVESTVGVGSSFTVVLPLEPVGDSPVERKSA